MASSGTFAFAPSNGTIVTEAFERIGVKPAELDRQQLSSAQRSLNYELQAWGNRGVNLWKVIAGVVELVPNQKDYVLQPDLMTLMQVWYSTGEIFLSDFSSDFNSDFGADYGPSQTMTDRILAPITREEYAMLPNKYLSGTPTRYWLQRVSPAPILTLYQPPLIGSPTYSVNWLGLQMLQNANIAGGETPDVAYRALDALTAKLAQRLAVKFAPARYQLAKVEADEAWMDFIREDHEAGPITFAPQIRGWVRL